MGSNQFSDFLKPYSDYIESIPVVGDVIKAADEVALWTDPSQLGTAAIGEIIGGDTKKYYTSPEARKGAAHTVGLAALAYWLGGSSAAAGEGSAGAGGTGAAAVPAGEAGYGTAATYGVTEAGGGAAGVDAGGLLGVGTEKGFTGWLSQMLGGSSVPQGAAGVGTAETYGAGNLVAQQGTLSKILSNKLLMNYISKLGADIAKYGGDTSKGMQFTNLNAATAQALGSKNTTDLLAKLLGTNEPDPNVTKNTITESSLYKDVLGPVKDIKVDPVLSSAPPEDEMPSDLKKKKRGYGSSFNAANLFA